MATAFTATVSCMSKKGSRPISIAFDDTAGHLGTFPDGVTTTSVLSGDADVRITDILSATATTVVRLEVFVNSVSTGIILPFASLYGTVMNRPVGFANPIFVPRGSTVAFKQLAA